MTCEQQIAYKRLQTVLMIGRNRTFAYVHDGFKPYLRATPKFRQYKRLIHKLQLIEMGAEGRQTLQLLLGFNVAARIANNPNTTPKQIAGLFQ